MKMEITYYPESPGKTAVGELHWAIVIDDIVVACVNTHKNAILFRNIYESHYTNYHKQTKIINLETQKIAP